MSQWTTNNTDQWGVGNDFQWGGTDFVEYEFEMSKYNLMAKYVKYFLTAKNYTHYVVAEDTKQYNEGDAYHG